jgi:CPA2 family monovalent cation:H+ antiporter-2
MHDISIITTFTGGLMAALVFGYLAFRVRLSPIVGYLLAGVVAGPFTPGFIGDHDVAEQFAELGVILLLFGIGLRFHLRELIAVWRVALPGALFQSASSTAALAALLHFGFGWDWPEGVILGLSISVASTVVMALVLGHDLHARIGHIAIGWTVVEDLLTVAILLLLPLFFDGDAAAMSSVGAALGGAALKVLLLGVVLFVLGRWVIPWALDRIAATRSRELFTLATLVLALGIAVGASEIFGVSMALGAFLAGLAVGKSEFAARAAGDALPMRDAFAVLFFVSVGMRCDPAVILASPALFVTVLGVVMIGKPLAAILVVRGLGRPMATAIPVGAALAQVGEFSFILGSVARDLHVLGDAGWNAMIGAAIVSIALNPTVYRLARKRSMRTAGLPPTDALAEVDPESCVLVGFGPVGRTLREILVDFGAKVTVIDLNLETVRELQAKGRAAVYGDVRRPATLEAAGIRTAGSVILSAEIEDAAEFIRQVRAVNPDIRVLARCPHLRDAAALQRAGAEVVSGEAEVAVALAEALLADTGATHLALTEQRHAIRRDLYEPLDASK